MSQSTGFGNPTVHQFMSDFINIRRPETVLSERNSDSVIPVLQAAYVCVSISVSHSQAHPSQSDMTDDSLSL